MIPQRAFRADVKPRAEPPGHNGLSLGVTLYGCAMDALVINPLGPANLSALSAVRPVQAVAAVPVQAPAQDDRAAGVTTLGLQDVAQTLFQSNLQAAALFPVATPAPGGLGLPQEAAASLLAALNPPQASAATGTVADATTQAASAVPATPTAIQAPATPDTTATTTATTTTAAALTPDLTAPPDALNTSLDLAMETALRFGAGVQALGAPTQPVGELGAPLGQGLVRDATSVLRVGNLQPHAGGPGPEAYTRPQVAAAQVIRSYQALPAATTPPGLDLLA